MGDIIKAAAGLDLKLHVQIELTSPPEAALEQINQLLAEVSPNLKLQ